MENQNFIQTISRTATSINTGLNVLSFPLVSSLDCGRPNLETARTTRIIPDEPHRQTIVITQPKIEKLSSEILKREVFEPDPQDKQISVGSCSKSNNNRFSTSNLASNTEINSCETINNPTVLPMSNMSGHLLQSLNPAQLTEIGVGGYFVPMGNFKATTTTTSNTDLPSPSSSSNSSNPASSTPQTSTRRHGEGTTDSNRKREMRLQKNREAARECRRKKKEYIRCLEERVAGLETQNKALIEELRQLKELYCQREETTSKSSNVNAAGVNKR